MQPPVTDRDAATAVTGIGIFIGIEATSLHVMPRLVFWRPMPIAAMSMYDGWSPAETCTLMGAVTLLTIIPLNFFLLSAKFAGDDAGSHAGSTSIEQVW